MSDEVLTFLQMLAPIVCGYIVYKDATKNEIKYKELWIIFAVFFFPSIVLYYIYKHTVAKKAEMSQRQIIELEMRKKAAANRAAIAQQGKLMQQMKEEESLKNDATLAELEQVKAERKAQKQQRLRELEEERRQQQEELAKKMHINT